ncbi:MAG TPA: 50S ribosomal protein L9 [Bacillota bacterium]|nr:50S ribosomal protein L9 [Bacillota bacterium]
MKVLLLESVKGLGHAGDVVEVKPGYANNYLFKRHLGVAVTKDNMNTVEMKRQAKIKDEENRLERAREIAAAVDGKHFICEAKTGSAGRLYGTVTSQNIADLLSKHGYEVDKRDITIGEPIKTVGTHQVTLRLHPDISVDFHIDVKADLG